ncbi:MAG TPA: CDP-diacylglycerol--glycerol-3-phosphate 3-phosphatidyltransferase [Actinomycetota bacterium]
MAIDRRPLTPLGLGWPNLISLFRLLVAPVLVILIAGGDPPLLYVAAAVFAVGAATDGLDGYLARRYESKTRTGQWLDPLADKVLVSAPVLTMAAVGRFPVWAAAVIIVRELGVSILRVYLGLHGVGMPATSLAKVKTTLQLLAITLYILPLPAWADGIQMGALIAALTFTVYTGVQYVADAGRLVRAETR